MRTAIFPARFDQLDSIRGFATQAARDAGMDDSETYAIELAIDEACTNIIEHAYQGENRGDIECTCESDDVCLTVVIRDHGKPFDPSTVITPDVDADIDDRAVGGLGVFLMKQMMDEVHFEPLGESGNVLTMIKRRKKKKIDSRLFSQDTRWRQIIQLGEQLMQKESLATRRELILETVSHLLDCQVDLWLDETLFRLPGLNQSALFSPKPADGPMLDAFTTGNPYVSKGQRVSMAFPLTNGGVNLGALQVARPVRPFRPKEIEILEGLVGHVSLALVAAHRFSVEQWRIEQLTLVRRVSAQIANVLDLNVLTRRVTKLIQRTFNYYYVAIFTHEPDQEYLRFRSSTGQARGRGKPLKIRVGDGLVGSVARTGEEAITNDVHIEPRFRFLDLLPQTQSEAVLPLKIEGTILGLLDVQSDRLGAFHPNDLLVLRALADTIAIAINGVRLYGELQTRAEHLEMVAEVSNDITSILNLDELFNKVAVLIQERLCFPYVHLFTVHPNRRQIIYEAGSGARSALLKGYVLDLDNDKGIISWVAREGQTILANDVTKEVRYQPSPFPPEDTRSELTIPLVFNSQVVGVLDLQSDHTDAFSEDDRFLCEALADSVASAIHNADLYQTERWRRQVADSLHEVAGSISSEAGVDDVLDSILHELEHNLPCDVAAVWLLEGEELYLAHIHGAERPDVDDALQRWPESYGFLSDSLTSELPVIRKPEDPIGPTGAARGFSADYSSIATALRAGDRPLGVLTLSHHAPGRYGHEAQAITSTFANYASVAIENARLYDAAQEQAYASAALLQIVQAVANSNSLDETIGSVVRITPILVGVKACAIFLWEQGHFRPAQSYGFAEEAQAVLVGKDLLQGDFPLLEAVRKEARTVVGSLAASVPVDWLDPVLAKTEQETFYALQTGEHLLIGFPLIIRNDFYGVMLVEEDVDDRRFRSKRVEIVTSIAQQVVLRIQNEQLQLEMVVRERLEHEVELARQIQKTFLPEHLPEIPGWDLAATWLTARQVGGDFYDVIELPGGRLGLLIADVSDKGMPAALFMALTRTLIRAVVYDTPSPAETLQRVNALIIPDNRQSMFVTAVYGVLSIESGEFTYANAGHNPPVRMNRAGKKLEFLHRTGAALGIIENLPMDQRTISLGLDDLLLLYTDGLTEAFSPDEDTFGEVRLQQALKLAQASSARGVLDALEASVNQFMAPLTAADDLTMLALKRIENNESLERPR
ncbi:MAG: GAF domain-containing protein [Anaerolineales bacterium]|jgi:serine phosphatase RsbU (regulator of sigma subunit)/anti-sigma regulatory factor (Ser/Thr protein kinase)/putative methionine-R-sulfoxide reductase with GAF domain